MKINKNTKKIKVTESDFKDFSNIATIPEHFEKSMVLYITTWQEVPDDNQKDTMTTKPQWFIEFENKQEQRWNEQQEFNKKQQEFNQQILSLVQSLVKRIDKLVIKNNLKE
ncbi:MAG: hypothetical protein IJK72_00470 [Mycoplasma sp.]|nr:hypothetical protein [Mycoplasma sp.]